MKEINAGDDIFFTRTMAGILEEQGFLEDALMIYNILALTSPSDEEIGLKIKTLKDLALTRRRKKGFLKRAEK
ncbi:MAG: hypothetical protein ACE5EZ_03965 [Thermodesulfobacteriota bacterium]